MQTSYFIYTSRHTEVMCKKEATIQD